MTSTPASGSQTLTVLVEEETNEAAPHPQFAEEGAERQAVVSWVRRRDLMDKQLDLQAVQIELDRVQAEVDGLIARLDSKAKHGFHLSEVQVSIGISPQGSIAVVTAGVQASLTLVYSRG
jgi:hypothetical protein